MMPSAQSLAAAILATHLGIVAFNIFGLVVVPLGGWFGWRFVSGFRWRLAHLLSLLVVALQALLGRACFLTIWENALKSEAAPGDTPPMIATWINHVLYWPLPLWVFVVGYVAVFLYALLLWHWIPPRRRGRGRANGLRTT